MIISALRFLFQAVTILFLPGAAAAARGKAGFRSGLEFVFFSVLLSVFISSIPGLALSYLGLFSAGLLAVWGLISSVAIFLIFPPRKPAVPLRKTLRAENTLLLVVLLAAAAVYFKPVPYIFGGWDPGVYVNTAAFLARSGTLFPTDPLAEQLGAEEIRRLAWRHSSGYLEKYPGFRYRSVERGGLIPEFYHLYPFWLAVFHSWFGWTGIFSLNPILGLAALAAVYLAVRELWGGKTALAAAALLAFNIVQVWQARFPTAEIISQLALFGGAAAVVKYLKRDDLFWAVAGAAAWGLFVISRVSSLLLWLPLAVFFYCRWWQRFNRRDLALLLPLAALTVFSFLPQAAGDWRYFANSLANLRLDGRIRQAIPVAAAAAAVVSVAIRLAGGRTRESISRALRSPPARRLLLAGLAGAGWYAYFVRPYFGPPSADRTNLVEIGWLLGPPVLLFAFLGILLFALEEKEPAAWLFFLLIATPAVVFVWRQMIHYHYLWAARRFADTVIPGLIVFAVYALRRLARAGRGGRLLALAAGPALMAVTVYNSAPLFFHREYRGAVEFMEKLAGRIEGADLVVVEGEFIDKLPTPLDLSYGFRVLPLYPGSELRPELLSRLLGKGRAEIFWLKDSSLPPVPGDGWEKAEALTYHSPLWERRYDRLPRRPDPGAPDGNFTVYLHRLVAGEEEEP